MAAYINSQSSSLAPTDFRLTTSFEEGNGTISVAVEKCQLCTASRRPFYCKDCVRKGDFNHSSGRNSARYSEKLKRWQTLKKERSKLLERIETGVLGKYAADAKVVEARNAQMRIDLLKDAIKETSEGLDADKQKLTDLQESNAARRAKSTKQEEKKKRICKYINHIQQRTLQQAEQVSPINEKLCNIRKQHLNDLMQFIFTVTEVQTKSECDPMTMSTVSALAEARRTTYIRGRWVYTDNGSEQQYEVVEPCLPGNGDYSAYSLWVSENKESATSPETDLNQRNPAHTISAALTYTTQMLSILSYFLSINLPRKLCYSEFCGNEMSDSQFRRAVSKLNHNILHICFTQNVNPEFLNAHHTIHNILMLLRSQDLGREGWFEVNSELMQSLDEGEPMSDDEDMSNSEGDEVDTGERDWEHVPVTLADMEVPAHSLAPYMSVQVDSQIPEGFSVPTSAAAGGLMSSAAASVTALWRAATSRKDK